MTERPILFSNPMVRALLEGRKTQTRRVMNFDRPLLRLRHDLCGDYPLGHTKQQKAGKPHRGHMNQLGAVSVVAADGKLLGCKPGEFDFACPYADGRTYLEDAHRWIIEAHDSRLWVRETFRQSFGASKELHYAADQDAYTRHEKGPWKPSIYMPRSASRITLEVVCVRIERLQDITESDAIEEGIPAHALGLPGHACNQYETLWDRINGKRAPWDQNPWVWVLEFRRVK